MIVVEELTAYLKKEDVELLQKKGIKGFNKLSDNNFYLTLSSTSAKDKLDNALLDLIEAGEELSEDLSNLHEILIRSFPLDAETKGTTESKQEAQKTINIKSLIGQFVVVSTPCDDNKSLNQFQKSAIEDLRSAVESALIESVSVFDKSEELSQKDKPHNK